MQEIKKAPRAFTPDDAKTVSSRMNRLLNNSKWSIPSYEWNMDSIQKLNDMPLNQMIDHLRPLLGAKLSMENMYHPIKATKNNYDAALENEKHKLESDFAEFKRLKCHPNEIAYRRTHHNQLPEAQPINYGDKKLGCLGSILGMIVIIVSITLFTHLFAPGPGANTFLQLFYLLGVVVGSGLGLLLLIVGIAFVLFAQFKFRISQPLASHKNRKILAQKQDILQMDDEYRRNNDCSETTLKEMFQYDENMNAIYSNYVSKVQKLETETRFNLQGYSKIVSENAIYFPPDQTKNMFHLLRIYETLLSGISTWSEAFEHVTQDERAEYMTASILQAIKKSTKAIVYEINVAGDEISNKVNRINKQIDEWKDSIQLETETINYWTKMAVAISMVQSSIVADINKNINRISNKYND